jgi:hypothetical protein
MAGGDGGDFVAAGLSAAARSWTLRRNIELETSISSSVASVLHKEISACTQSLDR